MKRWTTLALAVPLIAVAAFGLALGQSEQSDDPARFLANPEVRAAVDAQTPLTSVPLQPYGPFYLVDVKINDQGPFKFVIDSGTTSTIVDSAAARELGLLDSGESTRVVLDALSLGSARFAEVGAEVRDLDEIWGEGSPSGVFGFDLFGDRLVTLDLPLQRLFLRDGELPAADGREVLAYTVHSRDDDLGTRRVPTITVDVAGKDLNVELSPLGFGTLALPKEQMERFPLGSEPGVIGHSKNQDGTFPILGTSLDGSLLVGSHRFDNPSVFFSEAFDHPSLGSGTLEPFVLTFDLGQQRVRIERPSGRANPLVAKAASLLPQSGKGDDLKSAFNKNVDRVRLMVLLSPT